MHRRVDKQPRVPLHPSLELSHGDQDELAREHDLQFGLDLALEVVEADPSDAAASLRVSV